MSVTKIVLDLNEEAFDMDGDKIPELRKGFPLTWAEILRTHVLRRVIEATPEQILKYFEWCGNISSKEPLILTTEDFDLLYSLIHKSGFITLELKGPLLTKMKASRRATEKAEEDRQEAEKLAKQKAE